MTNIMSQLFENDILIVEDKVDLILNDLCIVKNNERIYIPSLYLVDDIRDKQSYLRGVFLMCGSINDPKTSRYHLEILVTEPEEATTCALILVLGIIYVSDLNLSVESGTIFKYALC